MNTLLLILVAVRALICGISAGAPEAAAQSVLWEEIPMDFKIDWYQEMPLSSPEALKTTEESNDDG